MELFFYEVPKFFSFSQICPQKLFLLQLLKVRLYGKGLTLSKKRQVLDSSKLKEVADDNFKFHENGRKFSKWVKNIVGKGEIARYEQFLLFPQCFQKTCTADT